MEDLNNLTLQCTGMPSMTMTLFQFFQNACASQDSVGRTADLNGVEGSNGMKDRVEIG
jgi:hypothetical protein